MRKSIQVAALLGLMILSPLFARAQKTATLKQVVNQATPAVSLTSNATALWVQSPLTLTAAITSPISTPTGSVTFLDGTTPIGTGALVNGGATLTSSSLGAGTHSITAVYSGDVNFVSAASPADTVQMGDFSIVATTSSQTVAPGRSTSYSFNISPVGIPAFPAAIQLSVSGLPTGATYTITPQTIASGSGATAVGLSVTVPQQISSNAGEKPSHRPLTPVALGLLLLPFSARLRRRAGKLTRLAAMLLMLVVGAIGVATLSGCGTSNGFLGQPERSYTVTITATSGTLTHATTVTLTVQ